MRFVRGLLDVRWASRRWWARTGVGLRARLKGASVDIAFDRSVQLGARVRFVVDAPKRTTLRFGPGCQIEDDVTFRLLGGTLQMGPGCSVRRGSVIHVGGELELVGDNIINYYNVIHCAEHIRLDHWAFTSEFVTIVDSRHLYGGEHAFFYENQESAPVEIGKNVWLANKSSVLMGVTIGDESIVAAHAVVHGDVPAKAIVGGVPARIIRQR